MMGSFRNRFLLLSALLATPVVLHSQVMADKTRQSKLEEVAICLEPERGELPAALKDAPDPFFTGRIPVSGKMTATSSNAGGEAAELGPEGILKGAADLLRPTGLMMAGKRRFIVSSTGDLYEVGKPLRVTLADGTHEIFLSDADGEGYVLKSGAITFTSKYVDHSDNGKGQ